MKIIAVSDEDSNIMFQLMGIDIFKIKAATPEGFIKEFNRILQNQEIGLIIMNEKYLTRYPVYFRKIKKRKLPIIVEIPDITGPLTEKYFEEFINNYLGLSYTGVKD